jgi:hypothetical protein
MPSPRKAEAPRPQTPVPRVNSIPSILEELMQQKNKRARSAVQWPSPGDVGYPISIPQPALEAVQRGLLEPADVIVLAQLVAAGAAHEVVRPSTVRELALLCARPVEGVRRSLDRLAECGLVRPGPATSRARGGAA